MIKNHTVFLIKNILNQITFDSLATQIPFRW